MCSLKSVLQSTLYLIMVMVELVVGNNPALRLRPTFHQDNYDECLLLEEDALYCSFHYHIRPISTTNYSLTWQALKKISSNPSNYRHDILRHGICVSTTCPNVNVKNNNETVIKLEIEQCYNDKYQHFGLKGEIEELDCTRGINKYPLDFIDKITALTFLVYLCFVIFATLAEPLTKREIFRAFSLHCNWKNLTKLKINDETEKFAVIQVFRFITSNVIVAVHAVALILMLSPANSNWNEKSGNNLFMWIVRGAAIHYTSIMMMISTFLIYNAILKSTYISKLDLIELLVRTFIQRCLKLAPQLFVITIFNATWLRHSGDGPFWSQVNTEYLRCRRSGWMNVLFMSIYAPLGDQCLMPTWYISIDFHYILIVLPLIYLFVQHPKTVWFVLGALIPLQILVTFFNNFLHEFPMHYPINTESDLDMKGILQNSQFKYQHCSLIANFAGPLVGLAFGKLYHNYNNKRLFTTKTQIYSWWILAFVLTCSILVPGSLGYMKVNVNLFWASTIVAFVKIFFCTGSAMIIFGFSQGIITDNFKNFVEHQFFFITGRLAYSVYIIHYSLIYIKLAKTRFPYYLETSLLVFECMGYTLFSFLLAVPFSLLFQAPVLKFIQIFIFLHEKKRD